MAHTSASSLIERRREHLFPVLNSTQIAIARRFGGEPRRCSPHEIVFKFGQVDAPAYLVLAGSIEVGRRDGLGGSSAITTHGPGELTGEVSQLAGGPSLADGRAGANGAEAAPFDSAQLRALVVATAEIGETVMRAFILRRVFLIETGAGLVLLGASDTPEALRLQNFLRRNAVPYTMLDPHTDPDAAHLIERFGISNAELPLAICPDGPCCAIPMRKLSRSVWVFCRVSLQTGRTMSRSSERAPPDWPPPCTAPQKVCRFWCSTRALLVVRRAHRRASRTTLDFLLAFPAKRLRAGRTSRRRNSAR